MQNKLDALSDLHKTLAKSIETYQRAMGDLEALPVQEKIKELIGRRTDNAAHIASYLEQAGADVDTDATAETGYSSLEWTAAKQVGESELTALIKQHEADVLAAYDAAIVPCTSDDSEFDFLNTQYQELAELVHALDYQKAAA